MNVDDALHYIARVPRAGLISLVRAYRLFLTPWLGSSCRFTPTCSAYALEALQRHGAATGSLLTAGRLVRCHPWCAGGHDPVPEFAARWFSRLLGGEASACVARPFPSEKNIQ